MNIDKLLVPIIYMSNDYIGHILKEYVFKPIMGDKTYPIIGSGMRPKGAKIVVYSQQVNWRHLMECRQFMLNQWLFFSYIN